MTGSTNAGEKSCPKALSRVKKRTPKLTIVNQCATATTGSRDMRVWPRNSRSKVRVRAPLSSPRSSGWPRRKVARKWLIVLTSRATATAVTPRHTTAATIWSALMPGSLLTREQALSDCDGRRGVTLVPFVPRRAAYALQGVCRVAADRGGARIMGVALATDNGMLEYV